MRRTEKLPPLQGRGAGQTATVSLPIGPVYHAVYLRATTSSGDVAAADWSTHVGDVRIAVDGNNTIDVSAAYLRATAQFHGQTLAPGILPIYLDTPWAVLPVSQDRLAYKSQGLASLTLEVDVKTDDLTSLSAYAVVSYPTVQQVEAAAAAGLPHPSQWGAHKRIQRFARSFATTGREEVADLPTGAFGVLGIDLATAAVGEVQVIADQREVVSTDAAVRAQQFADDGRTAQGGFTHLDFMRGSRLDHALPAALQDFRVRIDHTSAPGSYDIFVTSHQPR